MADNDTELRSSGQAANESFDDTQVGANTQMCPKPDEGTSDASDWIQIELIGEDDQPLVGERYRITLVDGSVIEGRIGSAGFVRIDGIDSGSCSVSFPELDEAAWESA